MRWKLLDLDSGETYETIWGPRHRKSRDGKALLIGEKDVCAGLGWYAIIAMKTVGEGLVRVEACDNEGYHRRFLVEVRHLTGRGEPLALVA